MSFWRHALRISARDLRIEGRTFEAIGITLPFGLVALFLAPLALPADADLLADVGPGMFWIVTVLFGMFVTFRQSVAETTAQREAIRLLGVDPAARFTGRVAASTLLLLAFEALLAPATVVLYAPGPIPAWGWLVPIAILAAAGLALLGTLVVDVTAGLRARMSLAPLLVAPLAAPLLVPAARAVDALRRGDGIVGPALVMTASVLALAIVGVLTAHPLQESST